MKRSMPFFNDSFSKQKNKFTALKNKLTNKKEEIKGENSFIKCLKKDYNILDKEEKKEPELAQLLLEKVNKLGKENVLEKRPFVKEDFSFLDESFNSVQLIENSYKNENLINFNSIFNKKLGEKEKIKRLKKVSIPLKEQCSFLDLALEVKIEKIKFSELKLKGIKKIAEASFSDVYLHDSVIYKVIPLDVGDKPNLDDFIKETYIHQTISKEKGVCKLKKVYLAKGKYSSYFLKAWEEFKKEKGTDNQNPTEYPKNNLFGIFVLEECGIDLEKYIFKSKEEVFCILNQIFRTISHLEKVYEFEHRDLHWGNILIKDSQIKIIDFSLARITKKKVIFIDLKNKEWLFSGNEKTDEQFGIYKKMKILTNDDWMIHTPKNNVLWLVYLINKIILLTNNKLRVSTFLNKIKSLVKNCKSVVDAYEALQNVL